MPSAEYIYDKYRRANDAPGDLAWASRQAKHAVCVSAEQLSEAEQGGLELNEDEKVLVQLLRLPRMYTDAETCGALPQAEARTFLRALHAAELLLLRDPDKARALVPIEVKRAREALGGKSSAAKAKPRKPGRLRAQVYRPSLAPEAPAAPEPAPKPAAPEPQKPASLAGTGNQSAEDLALANNINDFYKKTRRANFFDVLGVPRNVSTAQVKQAYRDLAKQFHPDRLAGHTFEDPETMQKRIEAIFNRIGEAYKVLQKDESRQEYIERLKAGLGELDKDGKRVRRPGEALVQHRKGLVFLQRKDFAQARRMFKIAAELDFEDPLFPAYIAWCNFLDEKRPRAEREQEARGALTEIMQKTPIAQAAYFLGMILKLAGDERGAASRFRKAVELDPNHPEAGREVRLAQMRHQKGQQDAGGKGAGLFDRLRKR